ANVRIALQEPKQLVDDRLQMQLLGGDQREALLKIEAHLPAEHAERAGAGTVPLPHAVLQDLAHQVQINLHYVVTSKSRDGRPRPAPRRAADGSRCRLTGRPSSAHPPKPEAARTRVCDRRAPGTRCRGRSSAS